MRRLLLVLALVGASLAGVAPAGATSSSPPDDCNINAKFCNMLLQIGLFAFGTEHSKPLLGEASESDPYIAVATGSDGWVYIQNVSNGVTQCWDADAATVQILLGNCEAVSNDFWKFFTSPDNGHFIENDKMGTHWAVGCCTLPSGNQLGFFNGGTNGDEYWNWKT